ncbi:hypothetical protein [Enterococcus hirae]|uniref:hypothetical protein n=1 Tax=Enterococcus hirae TaxID=1354 RepID=UPI001A9601BA|nr:hypothetical protein [Enterococcus hirae]MBO1087817.1 hypothetical protein [Enterococcus hirae]
MYDYLMEPKLQKTTDGEFIEVRTYLCGKNVLFIKLRSDVVLMIDEMRHSIKFLLPNKNSCYDIVTEIFPTKPSLGNLELSMNTLCLSMIEKVYKNNRFDRDLINNQLNSIKLFLSDSSITRDTHS